MASHVGVLICEYEAMDGTAFRLLRVRGNDGEGDFYIVQVKHAGETKFEATDDPVECIRVLTQTVEQYYQAQIAAMGIDPYLAGEEIDESQEVSVAATEAYDPNDDDGGIDPSKLN